MAYKYNIEAFKKIDETSSYLLGLLYADGNISDKGVVTLNLKSDDIELQHLLKQYLSTDKPIRFNNKNNSTCFSFQSKEISKTLFALGLIPRKSLTLKYPKFISEPNIKHFIRGYFDGDGCVSIKKSKYTTKLRVHFVGTYDMLINIQNIFINTLNISKRKVSQITKGKNTFQLEITKRSDVENLKKYLYDNASIYLSRKKQIFDTEVVTLKKDNTTSKYFNISYRKSTKRWRAIYRVNGIRKEKGFKTEAEALSFIKSLNLS
jgi:hypothetical protein